MAELPDGLTLIDAGPSPTGGGALPPGLQIVHPGDPIDFSAPPEQVRAAIGRLPRQARDWALRQWADAYVAREREAGTSGIDNAVRTIARGSFVGPFLDEINAAGSQIAHTLTGGYLGAPYDEAVAYQRARDRDVDTRYPVLATVGKVAGGLAGGVGALRTAGSVAGGPLGALVGGPLATTAPAATAMGRIAQGAGIGGAYGAVHGAGEAEGGPEARIEGAARGVVPGMLVGGVLSAGADMARAGARAWSNVRDPSRGAYERVLSTLGDETVDQFAARIATGAGNRSQAVQERTLRILGEEMQRAGGDVARAEAATIARIQAEAGVVAGTARDNIRALTNVHRDNPLLFGEQPMVAGRPEMPGTPASPSRRATPAAPATGDMGARAIPRRDPTEAEIRAIGTAESHPLANVTDYLANSGNTTSSAMVRNAVTARQADNNPQFIERLWRLLPDGHTVQDAADLMTRVRDQARAAYAAAYAAPINNEVFLRDLPRVISGHLDRMAGRSGEQADALRRALGEFFIDAGGQRLTMQTLQHMQDARQAVRGMIEEARRAGRDHIVNTLQPLYRDVTGLMERASPLWAQANRQWADGAAAERGFELGQALVARASPAYRERLNEFRQLAPDAQQLARIGFIQRLEDTVAGLRDTHDISKLFQNTTMRSLVREVLGPRAAMTFERAVRDQGVMARTAGNLGNSRTANRLATREQMETDTGLIAAAQNLSSGGVRQWLANTAMHLLTERRNRELARIVTTPMSDTAQVARHIARMRQEQQRLAAYEQRRGGPLAAAGAVGGAAGGAVAYPREE